VHELVIVLSDFYVSQETPDRELPAGVALPGLQQATRFAARTDISGGWRAWLSRWLTGSDGDPPATTAAASAANTQPAARLGATPPAHSVSRRLIEASAVRSAQSNAALPANSPPAIASPAQAPPAIALIATPVNLIAGMTSIHLDRRSILRLTAGDQAALAADFQRVFHDSGFHLQPLDAGDFVMLGPPMPITDTSDPARLLGTSMADARGAGATNQTLLRLGAEIEMWLHDHAVNDARRRRGEQPVTALWLWGAGPIPPTVGLVPATAIVGAAPSDAARDPTHDELAASATPESAAAAARESTRMIPMSDGSPQSDIAFGRDSYVAGLWAAALNAKVLPFPQQLADVFGYPHAQRAVLVIEIGLMLQSNPSWTIFDALGHIDRAFITPAIEALNRGQCERLVILANDHELTVRARDRWKFWRRTPPGLSGLQ
jgi:hypothetical protein